MFSYRSYTDKELACLLAKGDHSAFTEIYDRYAGILYVHARKKLTNRETARDLVQDLFASLWNRRATFSKDTQLSGYLYAAIRYKVINRIIREKRLTEFEATLVDRVAEEQVLTDYLVREKELRQLIEAEASRLPKKMREIFYMSRELQLSHKEIAEQLNLSQATVKKQVNNALKVLRVKLEAFFGFTLF